MRSPCAVKTFHARFPVSVTTTATANYPAHARRRPLVTRVSCDVVVVVKSLYCVISVFCCFYRKLTYSMKRTRPDDESAHRVSRLVRFGNRLANNAPW